jgi:5-hydroxyisourate hydrolase-like protein (transthyretin family)
MRSIKTFLHAATLSIFFASALAQAANVTGTVTDKTTGKPASGDSVVLVEPQAGMAEVAQATTDAKGHYSLNRPSNNPALVKVTHQGAEFFVEAPQSGSAPEISVYDVAAKVEGVFIEADVLEIQSENGQLNVIERYFVHNTSMPPRTQWSPHSFEIVLPDDAIVSGAEAQRPSAGSLPTEQRAITHSTSPSSPTRAKKTRSSRSATRSLTAAASSPSIRKSRSRRKTSAFCSRSR